MSLRTRGTSPKKKRAIAPKLAPRAPIIGTLLPRVVSVSEVMVMAGEKSPGYSLARDRGGIDALVGEGSGVSVFNRCIR